MKKKYVQPACYAVEMEGDFCANQTSLGKIESGSGSGIITDDASASSYSYWDNSEK